MPLPKRKSDESREEFIARCMKDPVMVQEFPDANQRRAICEKQARVKTDGKPKLPRFSMSLATARWSGVRPVSS